MPGTHQTHLLAPGEPNTRLDTLVKTPRGVLSGMEGVVLLSVVLSHLGTEDFGAGST